MCVWGGGVMVQKTTTWRHLSDWIKQSAPLFCLSVAIIPPPPSSSSPNTMDEVKLDRSWVVQSVWYTIHTHRIIGQTKCAQEISYGKLLSLYRRFHENLCTKLFCKIRIWHLSFVIFHCIEVELITTTILRSMFNQRALLSTMKTSACRTIIVGSLQVSKLASFTCIYIIEKWWYKKRCRSSYLSIGIAKVLLTTGRLLNTSITHPPSPCRVM